MRVVRRAFQVPPLSALGTPASKGLPKEADQPSSSDATLDLLFAGHGPAD